MDPIILSGVLYLAIGCAHAVYAFKVMTTKAVVELATLRSAVGDFAVAFMLAIVAVAWPVFWIIGLLEPDGPK